MPTSFWRTSLSYLSGWPRRAAAVLCLLAALGTALTRGRPSVTPTVPTVVTSHAVSAGSVLSASDLTLAAWPASAAPADGTRAVTAVVGRRVAATVRRGMPITAADLLEPAVAAALARGQAASTVELTTSSQVAILRVGDHVDLYPSSDTSALGDTTPAASGSPAAQNAEVLSVLPASDATPDDKPALVVATDRSAAARLAARASAAFVATLVQPP